MHHNTDDVLYSLYVSIFNPLYTKGGPLRTPEGDFLWSCRNYIN